MSSLQYIVLTNTGSEQLEFSSADILVDTINGEWVGNTYRLDSGIYIYSMNITSMPEVPFVITITNEGESTQYVKNVRSNQTCSDILLIPPTENRLISIWIGRVEESSVNLKIVRLGDA